MHSESVQEYTACVSISTLRLFVATAFLLALVLLTPACQREDRVAINGNGREQEIRMEYDRDAVKVCISLNKGSLTVAENLHMIVAVEVKQGYAVEFPSIAEKLDGFSVVEHWQGVPQLVARNRVLEKRVYILEPFLAGNYRIPSLKFIYRERQKGPYGKASPAPQPIATEEIAVPVRSVLGEDLGKVPFNPIFGPLQLPPGPRTRLFAPLVISLLTALVGVLYCHMNRRKRGTDAADLPVSVHEIAYRQLQEALDAKLFGGTSYKLLYIRVADVMREYVEKKFQLHASTLTTEEFLKTIDGNPLLLSAHRAILEDFLHLCDQVKFAEYRPNEEEILKSLDACKAFIEATRSRDEPAVQTEGHLFSE